MCRKYVAYPCNAPAWVYSFIINILTRRYCAQGWYLANGHNLDREGVLVVVGGILLIVADQLLVCTVAHGHNALQKI